MTVLLSYSNQCLAFVIDDFKYGHIDHTFEVGIDGYLKTYEQTQIGLPFSSVIGGKRNVDFLYGGTLAIDTFQGSLDVNFLSELYENGSLNYYNLNSFDLTADRSNRFLIKINSFAISDESELFELDFILRSSDAVVTHSLPIQQTSQPIIIAIPFSMFTTFQGEQQLSVFQRLESIRMLIDPPANHPEIVTFSLSINEIVTAGPTTDGDFNYDGNVDLADYETWKSQYGMTGLLSADGNGDKIVNAADYTVWRDQYSLTSLATATSVPEPTALSSFLFISVLASSIRCRRQ